MGIIAIIDTQTAYTTNTSSLQQRKETCKDTSSGVAECSCLSNRTLLADGKKCSSSQSDRVPVPLQYLQHLQAAAVTGSLTVWTALMSLRNTALGTSLY